MKRRTLTYGLLMASVAKVALADDLTITGAPTSPLATATAANSSPGNITLIAGSVLSIASTGAAVTLNSNNLIDNQGSIQNTFAGDGAIGVRILGGFTGSYLQEANGAVNVTGGGANNYGILVDGGSAFNGNITLNSGSVLVSHGVNGASIAIQAPLIGNLATNGLINAFDKGANGVVVTAPVTGTVSNGGTMFLAAYGNQTLFSSAAVDPLTGSALAIGANISGGVLNAGPVDVNDLTTGTGSIQSSSNLPTFSIAPSVAGAAASNITIGYLAGDTTNASFSVVNRGAITNRDNDPGISTVAMRIGEGSATAAAHTTTLIGGFFNRGTIQASAESDNFNASAVSAAPTNATGLEIGAGAILLTGGAHAGAVGAGSTQAAIVLDAGASSTDQFYKGLTVVWNGQERLITDYNGTTKIATIAAFNGSSAVFDTAPNGSDPFTISSAPLRNDGTITAIMTGTQSGTVTSVLIQPFGTVAAFNNTGTVKAEAYSSLTTTTGLIAYGIRDLSGTLTDISNSGKISAFSGYNPSGATGLAVPLDDGSQKAVAIDLSAGTANQRVVNSGSVNGDIYFGKAGMQSASTAGNQLFIEGSSAGVSGTVHPTASGTLDIHISEQQTGGTFLTYSSQATSIDVGKSGQVVFLLTKTSRSQTAITTTGNVNFASGSAISLLPGSFLSDGTYRLISSGGNVHFDDAAGTTALTVPFLFHSVLTTDNSGAVTADGKSLQVTITRKTTAELGLTGNSAAIYDSLTTAALSDDTYGAALMNLTTKADVQTALSTAVPDIAGGVRALAEALTDQSTGVIAARQRALLTTPNGGRDEFQFWGQEFYNNISHDDTSQPGFSGAGQGLSLGAEWGNRSTGRYGVGLGFFSSQEIENQPRDTKTDGDWTVMSAYAAWRVSNIFVAPQVNVGVGSMQSRRLIQAGNIARSAAAKWQSQLASGGVTAGYVFDLGHFQIMPTIALDAMYLRESDYGEAFAGGLGVALKSQNQNSLRGFAGVIGQGTFNYDQGVLMPQVIAGYTREFLNDPATIDGYFEAAPGSPFHLTGPTLDPGHVIGGMSFGYVLRNWSAGVNYDASANSGSLAQSATINLTSRF